MPNRPDKRETTDPSDRLPRGPVEFRVTLRRRLELIDREIRALDEETVHARFVAAAGELNRLREVLSARLDERADEASWCESRSEMAVLWKRLRHEFERLAALCQRRHVASPGRGAEGPRW